MVAFSSPSTHNLIPSALMELCQWTPWKYGEARKDGKRAKPPIQARTGQVCDALNPANWYSFPDALEAVRKHKATGVGFVVTNEDNIVGIDLDHCRDIQTGAIDDWAEQLVTRIPSYWEVTPSGTGLRCFAYGSLPTDGTRRGSIEVYTAKHFLTVTGQRLKNSASELQDCHSALTEWYQEAFPTPARETVPRSTVNPAPPPLAETDVLSKARHSPKSGAAFVTLFDRGDTSAYNDESRADLRLCGMLAYWTGNSPEQINMLFRQSALMRDKWEREDYRDRTIAKAIAGCPTPYGSKRHPTEVNTGGGIASDANEQKTPDGMEAPDLNSLMPLIRGSIRKRLKALGTFHGKSFEPKPNLSASVVTQVIAELTNLQSGVNAETMPILGRLCVYMRKLKKDGQIAHGDMKRIIEQRIGKGSYMKVQNAGNVMQEYPGQEYRSGKPWALHDALKCTPKAERDLWFDKHGTPISDANPKEVWTVEHIKEAIKADLPKSEDAPPPNTDGHIFLDWKDVAGLGLPREVAEHLCRLVAERGPAGATEAILALPLVSETDRWEGTDYADSKPLPEADFESENALKDDVQSSRIRNFDEAENHPHPTPPVYTYRRNFDQQSGLTKMQNDEIVMPSLLALIVQTEAEADAEAVPEVGTQEQTSEAILAKPLSPQEFDECFETLLALARSYSLPIPEIPLRVNAYTEISDPNKSALFAQARGDTPTLAAIAAWYTEAVVSSLAGGRH